MASSRIMKTITALAMVFSVTALGGAISAGKEGATSEGKRLLALEHERGQKNGEEGLIGSLPLDMLNVLIQTAEQVKYSAEKGKIPAFTFGLSSLTSEIDTINKDLERILYPIEDQKHVNSQTFLKLPTAIFVINWSYGTLPAQIKRFTKLAPLLNKVEKPIVIVLQLGKPKGNPYPNSVAKTIKDELGKDVNGFGFWYGLNLKLYKSPEDPDYNTKIEQIKKLLMEYTE